MKREPSGGMSIYTGEYYRIVTPQGKEITDCNIFLRNGKYYLTGLCDSKRLPKRQVTVGEVESYYGRLVDMEQLIEKYYPSLFEKTLSRAERESGFFLEDGRYINTFKPVKATRPSSPDESGWDFVCMVNGVKRTITISLEDQSAWVEGTVSAAQIISKYLGEQLNLRGSYDKYSSDVKLDYKDVRFDYDSATKKWFVRADIPGKGSTQRAEIAHHDYTAIRSGIADPIQVAVKYVGQELSEINARQSEGVSQDMIATRSNVLKR